MLTRAGCLATAVSGLGCLFVSCLHGDGRNALAGLFTAVFFGYVFTRLEWPEFNPPPQDHTFIAGDPANDRDNDRITQTFE